MYEFSATTEITIMVRIVVTIVEIVVFILRLRICLVTVFWLSRSAFVPFSQRP